MLEIKVHGFYRGGVHATVTRLGGLTQVADSTHTFGAAQVRRPALPSEVGYIPQGRARALTGPAHGTIEVDGATYLALNAGHVYKVTIQRDGHADQQHVLSAEAGTITVPLPAGATVEVSEHAGMIGDDEDGSDDEGVADEEE